MSQSDERDAFERLVDRVLAYRPKKAKRKKRKVAKKKKTAGKSQHT
jgi:hypothetical protein